MVYTLFVWAIVGFAGAGNVSGQSFKKEYDWKPLAHNMSLKRCEEVARQLSYKKDMYRCIDTRSE